MKKDLRIEKMRIIACLMVILTHVSARVYGFYEIGSFKWQVFNIYDSLSKAAVPVFIMISGLLLLDNKKKLSLKKIYCKYIPKMLFILVLGSFIYALWKSYGLHNIDTTWKAIIKDTLKGPNHFWYISAIIFLYILTPFFRIITSKDNPEIAKYCYWVFLVSSFFISLSVSTFLPFSKWINLALNKIYFNKLLFWYSYFLLGYYIYNTNYLDKYKKISYVLGIIGFVLCILLTSYTSTFYNANKFDYYNNFGLTVYCPAVALIYLTKNFKANEKFRKLIESISTTTLGVYIIHMMVIQFILYKINYDLASTQIIYTIPLMCVMVFIISFIIVFIYKQLIHSLKKIILK